MAEILKEWLSERLHRCISWEADGFGEMMKDGQIIAQVLLSYHVINNEQYYAISSTDSITEMTQNWKYIRQWLKDIDVLVSDLEISNVLDGQGSALLRLFYKLFLQLDKKDRTEYIKEERKRMTSLVEKLDTRFTTEKVPEDKYIKEDDLARPLYNEKYFIEWQRKKEAEVKDLYEYVRWKHLKTLEKLENSKELYEYARKKTQLTSKQKLDMEKFALRFPNAYVNYNYDELLQMDENATQTKPKVDSEWTKSYMDTLITKSHRKTHSEDTHNRLINSLTSILWDEAVNEEENKLDLELSKKVLKLSQFEKQMCTQIMETKQQARNLANNRIRAEREFSEQRENQFSLFLDTVKEQIHSEMDEIDFERNRNNRLHRKLFDEKVKRKRQHCYEACYEAVESLIDYVCKVAEFSQMLDEEEEIPHYYIHQWKTLFYKMQPVFNIIDPVEEILKTTNLEEEQIPEEEELIKLESNRQGVLNETEFLEYNNYLSPWILEFLIPNYDADSEDRKFEYLGQNVLGHVVYKLLEMKYPFPPRIPPAELPDFPVRAIIRGLPDKSISQPMQILLDEAKIHVVRIESVVNYCLQQFKNEMLGFVEIGISYDSFFHSAKEEDKEFVKELKFDGEQTYGSNLIPVTISLNSKLTQTPKALPETEVVLSTSAQLGKYAYEALSEGQHMTDSLLSTMIVEYLKFKQKTINGFVVINYPNTYCQAQVMEEVFTGVAPPDEKVLENIDDTYLEETIIHHIRKEKDEFKQIRSSKLVRNPHVSPFGNNFKSFFTAYIKLMASEDILQEDFAWNLCEENSDLIDRFYASLGMNYSMYYEIIDKGVLSELCRYIIGDVSIPPKPHNELYGEEVLSLLDFPDSYDRRKRSKTFKPEVASSLLEETSEVSQEGHVSMDLIGEHEHSVVVDMPQDSEEIKLLAGEEDWAYADSIIPEAVGATLASCWEEIEKTYINDIEQLFLSKRLTMNVLVPYINFLREKMDQIINLPSKKPLILAEFQQQYNEYENDWRAIDVVKSEWHCRVQALQNVLYDICDKRKIFAEQQRHSLIYDNFTMAELTSLVNTYISCMQAELNRFFLSYQILHDFYYTSLKGLPPTDKLASKELSKIIRESEDPSQKRSGDDKLFKQLKNQFIEMQIKNVEIDFNNNPFNTVIENNVKFALRTIKDINDTYRALISREHSEAAKIGPIKKKDTREPSQTSTDNEEQKQNNIIKCLDEWTMGINGEMFRASLRMVTLQYKCLQDMKLFIDSVARTFGNIQNDINNHYAAEIKSVNNFCSYVKVAIEEGKQIPETLFLENENFFIDANILKLEPMALEPWVPGTESDFNMDFNFSHLAHLRTMFKLCAPTGFILHKSFVYLLQDFIFFGKERAEGPFFPEAWKRVDPNQIEKLTNELYGNAVYIDWRDFLLRCLNLKFPKTDELLFMRKHFRCIDVENTETISRKDFIAESLWFEDNIVTQRQLLRFHLTKHFIFELFETSEDRMNYSHFLLMCCKYDSPIDGFVNAISMIVGKKICYVLEECEPVIEKLIALKQYKEACRALAVELAHEIIDDLFENAYIRCESTEITEVQISDLNIKTKKGKGKGGKKLNDNQKQSVEIKTKISVPELPLTYICGPCQAEEEVREAEQIEEISSSASPQEDLSLAYTVSQSVIWKVLKTCLPSYFTLVKDINQDNYTWKISTVLNKLETDTENGDIYICKFVDDAYICRFLHKIKIFSAHDLMEVLSKVYCQE